MFLLSMIPEGPMPALCGGGAPPGGSWVPSTPGNRRSSSRRESRLGTQEGELTCNSPTATSRGIYSASLFANRETEAR